MPEPLVACVLLTADRAEMTARAVRCFKAQTYRRKHLLIFDSGIDIDGTKISPDITQVRAFEFHGATIGELRNAANKLCAGADLIAHFDSDDWSHPQRLAEQVALIESDPKLAAVGYSDMLFWVNKCGECGELGVRTDCTEDMNDARDGEAWLYTSTSSYLLGTSLLYRRAAWERKPFEHVNQGEDRRWLAGLRTRGVRSTNTELYNPCMIASVHGANTSSRIDPASENFKRAPEFDAFCRETMALPIPALK